MLGQTISHYKILAKLGAGGMGVVYKAEDVKLKRQVALKFLPPELSRDDEAKERFVHEAQAASALDHPNICTIYEIGETEDEQIFIAMAYYEGETLKERVAKGEERREKGEERDATPLAPRSSPFVIAGGLQVVEVIDLAIQMAQGLAKAHEKGIVHRDIKPANVMITKDGVVKILDFGLAKLVGGTRLTKTGSTMGTATYMSPEQVHRMEVDHRTDIWSLGVVMYEMLTGKLPFEGEYEQAVMYAIVNMEPKPLMTHRSDVPVGLEQIVKNALAKEPEERYQHVDELLADLKELETTGKISRRKVANLGDGKKWLKRIAVPAGIGLLLVLGFLLLRPLLFEQALVSARKPIAVISFENLTGDTTYNYLQKAIPNLLITSLEQSPYLQVTTWERMNDLLEQMGKENVKIVDKNLGFELCRMDSVDVIVLGSFTKAGNMFATDVKVLNVSTKALIKSASARGEGIASILENQIDALSKEISRGIGLSKRKIETTQVRIAEVTTTSLEAYNYFIRGREYSEKYYDKEALPLFERAVALDSTFATAYFYLAMIYRYQWPQKYIQAYEKAMTYSKRIPEKERAYIETFYNIHIHQNYEKAFSIVQKIVQRYPKDKYAHHTLAALFSVKKQHDKAIEEYRKVLNLDPKDGLTWCFQGYAYALSGDFAKALESLNQYAALSPGEANPLDSKGDIYLSMGDVDAAIAAYKEVQAIKPNFGPIDWKLAYCYAMKEDYAETMNWLDRQLAMHSSGFFAYYYKGFFQYIQGRTKQALKNVQREYQLADSLRSIFSKAQVERLRGWIYYDLGEFDAGRIAIKKSIKFLMEDVPKNEPYYKQYHSFYLGLVNVKLGQIDSAKYHLNDCKLVLPLAEREGNVWTKFRYDLLQAEILLADGLAEQALAAVQKIKPLGLILDWSIPGAIFYNLPFKDDIAARAYQKLGNLDGAIAEYERLTTIDRTSIDRRLIPARFHYHLAKLYEQKGLTAKAIARYEHFLTVWKNADPDWPELSDAKARLARLKETVTK